MLDRALIEYYSFRAGEYEEVYAKPERQEEIATLRLYLHEVLAGHDILEIACGTGYWTEVIAPVARSVVAIDLSRETLIEAGTKTYPPGRVRFEVADAFHLQGIDGDFTAVLAAFWWSHVPRQALRRFLDGLHRRLGEGGKVVLMDNLFVPGSSTPIVHKDAEGNTYQDRQLADGSRYRLIKNFPTSREVAELVGPATDNLTITHLQYYWCACYEIGS